jgi:predicted nucleotide-binding protein (sugar kinase/HSP70/actin superfamily)
MWPQVVQLQEMVELRTGLPDGIFLYPKSRFWYTYFEGLGMEIVEIFMSIWIVVFSSC